MNGLRLRDLKIIRGMTTIVDGIDLDLPAGARHVIVGHNGAGKTTLLNTIGGQVLPAQGRIWLDGVDITAWSPYRRARSGLARTWQHPMLCGPLTVAEHLQLARLVIGRHIEEVLERFGLTALRHERVAELPYGTQRCLEFVLAVSTRPRLLLLDEPSAALSLAEMQAVMHTLSTLDDRTTLVLTDHHPEIVAHVATSTTYLAHGRILTVPPAVLALADLPRRPERARQRQRQPRVPGPAALEVRSLSARYGAMDVLHDVSFAIYPGEITVITGNNGAGKTTLLNAIAGIGVAHTAGMINLRGRVITNLSPSRRHHLGLSVVPQDRRVFARLTVAENLRLPRGGADPSRNPAELLFPQLQGRQHQMASTLSGGEQQLLAFARAVISRPTVLLLDEPFEGLAAAATERMRQAIAALAEAGTAVLIAEHRLHSFKDLADHVRHLANGTLRPAELSDPYR